MRLGSTSRSLAASRDEKFQWLDKGDRVVMAKRT